MSKDFYRADDKKFGNHAFSTRKFPCKRRRKATLMDFFVIVVEIQTVLIFLVMKKMGAFNLLMKMQTKQGNPENFYKISNIWALKKVYRI